MTRASKTEIHQEGFIRLALVAPFVEHLSKTGIKPGKALKTFGLDPDQITNSSVYVHSELVFGLLNALADLANDPFFGAHVGETFDLQNWPPFALSLQSPGTLFEFFARFVRLVPQESSAVRHSLIVEADRAIYRVSRLQEPAVAPVQVTGFGAAIYLRLLRLVSADAWDPSKVVWQTRYISSIPPNYMNAEIQFIPDAGMQLSFPVDWLHRDISTMIQSTPNQPNLREAEISLIAALRSVLRGRLDQPDLGIHTVSGLLGIEAARFRKALKSHGTTLPRELKRLKIDVAKDLLLKTNKSAAEIGETLGYSDKAHFTRFFKSQTGQTPRAFRTRE